MKIQWRGKGLCILGLLLLLCISCSHRHAVHSMAHALVLIPGQAMTHSTPGTVAAAPVKDSVHTFARNTSFEAHHLHRNNVHIGDKYALPATYPKGNSVLLKDTSSNYHGDKATQILNTKKKDIGRNALIQGLALFIILLALLGGSLSSVVFPAVLLAAALWSFIAYFVQISVFNSSIRFNKKNFDEMSAAGRREALASKIKRIKKTSRINLFFIILLIPCVIIFSLAGIVVAFGGGPPILSNILLIFGFFLLPLLIIVLLQTIIGKHYAIGFLDEILNLWNKVKS